MCALSVTWRKAVGGSAPGAGAAGRRAMAPPVVQNPTRSAPEAESLLRPFGGSGVKHRKLINKRAGLGYRLLGAGPSAVCIETLSDHSQGLSIVGVGVSPAPLFLT